MIEPILLPGIVPVLFFFLAIALLASGAFHHARRYGGRLFFTGSDPDALEWLVYLNGQRVPDCFLACPLLGFVDSLDPYFPVDYDRKCLRSYRRYGRVELIPIKAKAANHA